MDSLQYSQPERKETTRKETWRDGGEDELEQIHHETDKLDLNMSLQTP
jgi:hypothetical protein